MPKGRKYSAQYKQEAVDLLRKTGKSVTEVAEDLGIPVQNLSRWKAAAEKLEKKAAPKRSASAAELEVAELRRELERVRMERDFLKKAAAFFAKDEK